MDSTHDYIEAMAEAARKHEDHMGENRFCVNCKNYQPAWACWMSGTLIPATCLADALRGPVNMETGGRPPCLTRPADLRQPGGACGPTGLHFEAKPDQGRSGSGTAA